MGGLATEVAKNTPRIFANKIYDELSLALERAVSFLPIVDAESLLWGLLPLIPAVYLMCWLKDPWVDWLQKLPRTPRGSLPTGLFFPTSRRADLCWFRRCIDSAVWLVRNLMWSYLMLWTSCNVSALYGLMAFSLLASLLLIHSYQSWWSKGGLRNWGDSSEITQELG